MFIVTAWLPQGSLSNVYVRRPDCVALQRVTSQLISQRLQYCANTARASLRSVPPVHWALLRTLPFGTEGSLLRWAPQPHAAAPCTPHTSLLGASFKPDVAGRACISGGDQIAKAQTTSRGRVAMGLFGKRKKQKEARRSRAPGYHDATPPRLLNP